MSNENEPPKNNSTNYEPGEATKRFLSIPNHIRDELILRSKRDFAHLKIRGYSIQDIPVDSILPNGNKVIIDKQGKKLFRAPNITKPISTPADN